MLTDNAGPDRHSSPRMSSPQQENHLLGAVVERSLGERTIFPYDLQPGEHEQSPQVRICKVAQP